MGRMITLGEPMAVLIAEETGRLEDVRHFERGLAGAELNVAVGISRLGHEAVYLTRLGADPYGRYIRNFIEKEEIRTEAIYTDAEHLTGSYLKGKVLTGDPEIFYYRKNSAASCLSAKDVEQTDFSGAEWLHLTGISPALSESCREAVLATVKKAREHGMTVSFDPNIRPSLWKSEEEMRSSINQIAVLCDYVFPGIGEGKILTGFETPEEIADFYLKEGCAGVVVKNGKQGALYKLRGETMRAVPGFDVEHIVDTVGAGDGFAAGVISGCMEGLPMEDAVRRGNAVGAMAIMAKGDNEGLPDRDRLNAFMESY